MTISLDSRYRLAPIVTEKGQRLHRGGFFTLKAIIRAKQQPDLELVAMVYGNPDGVKDKEERERLKKRAAQGSLAYGQDRFILESCGTPGKFYVLLGQHVRFLLPETASDDDVERTSRPQGSDQPRGPIEPRYFDNEDSIVDALQTGQVWYTGKNMLGSDRTRISSAFRHHAEDGAVGELSVVLEYGVQGRGSSEYHWCASEHPISAKAFAKSVLNEGGYLIF